jgi:hypothetical protein
MQSYHASHGCGQVWVVSEAKRAAFRAEAAIVVKSGRYLRNRNEPAAQASSWLFAQNVAPAFTM